MRRLADLTHKKKNNKPYTIREVIDGYKQNSHVRTKPTLYTIQCRRPLLV